MNRQIAPLFIGITAGLLIGGGLRYGVSDGSPPSVPLAASHLPASDEVSPSEVPKSIARPTLDEVLQFRSATNSQGLARYLEDATIEEILELNDLVARGETRLFHMKWMIEVRGLELDPEAMLAWAENQGRFSDYYTNIFLKRWAVIDPRAALSNTLSDSNSKAKTVLSAMKDGDPDRAIEALRELLPHAPELRDLEERKWAEMAKKDVQAALAGVMGLENVGSRQRNLNAVMQVWVTNDPQAALGWIESQDSLEGKNKFMLLAVQGLADTDPALAQTKLDTLVPGSRRMRLERDLMEKWTSDNPDAAVAWVSELPNGPRRDILFASMTGALKKDPEKLFAFVEENNLDKEGVPAFQLMLAPHYSMHSFGLPSARDSIHHAAALLAKQSPEKAIAALYNAGDNYPNDVVEMWVTQNPQEAATWVATLAESEFAESMQGSVYWAWSEQSPEDAAAFLNGSDLSDKQGPAEAIARQWARQDAEASVAWIAELDEGIRDSAYHVALSEILKTDPVQALQYVNHINDPEAQRTLIGSAVQTWRAEDPEGVMTWLQDQPEQVAIESVVEQTARAWVLSQPQAASEWIQSMNPSPRKDHAASGIVKGLLSPRNPGRDLDAAEIWAQSISDPVLRNRHLNAIAEQR